MMSMRKYFGTLAFILCLGLLPVFAAGTDTGASIEFEAGTGPTKPVDPENPDNPDPELPEVPGSLVIVHATNFTFGTGQISTTTQFYNVTTQNPNVQTVDLRGNESGWTLSASITPFTDADDEPSLPGARLHLSGATFASTSGSDAPTATNAILTTDNTPKDLVTAAQDSNQGKGLWVIRWYPPTTPEDPNPVNNLVRLEVPGNAATLGAHTATITWTLSDAP